MRGLVITVGTGRDGKDIAHGLLKSIKAKNPNYILFFVTDGSIATREIITSDPQYPSSAEWIEDSFNESDDVEHLILHYRTVIKAWMRKNQLQSSDVMADFTSGTKPMSAALVVTALDLNLESLSYIRGERSSDGRVSPGTERIEEITPGELLFGRVIDQAITFFNLYQYKASVDLINTLPTYLSAGLKNKRDYLSTLFEAYYAWDIFKIDTAKQKIDSIKDKVYPEDILIEPSEILKSNCQFLAREMKDDYNLNRLIDLTNNADRRIEEGRFDDALGRIYRAWEYMGQLRLYDKRKIETSKMTIEDIPSSIQSDFKSRNGKVYPGLVGTYKILKEYDDDLGTEFIREYDNKGSLRDNLDKRNYSILAHGFKPVDEKAAKELIGILKSYIERFFASNPKDNWNQISKYGCFPKISLK